MTASPPTVSAFVAVIDDNLRKEHDFEAATLQYFPKGLFRTHDDGDTLPPLVSFEDADEFGQTRRTAGRNTDARRMTATLRMIERIAGTVVDLAQGSFGAVKERSPGWRQDDTSFVPQEQD